MLPALVPTGACHPATFPPSCHMPLCAAFLAVLLFPTHCPPSNSSHPLHAPRAPRAALLHCCTHAAQHTPCCRVSTRARACAVRARFIGSSFVEQSRDNLSSLLSQVADGRAPPPVVHSHLVADTTPVLLFAGYMVPSIFKQRIDRMWTGRLEPPVCGSVNVRVGEHGSVM